MKESIEYLLDENEKESLHFVGNPHRIQQYYVIRAVCILTIFFALPLGLNALRLGHGQLGGILLLVALVALLNFLLVINKKLSYERSADLALIPLFVLMIYLVATGGVENTGPLWIFSMPAVALFLYGAKKGLAALLLFSLSVASVLYFPPELAGLKTDYSDEFKLRLLLVFLLVVALTLAYAFSTSKLFEQLHGLTRKLSSIAGEDQLTGLLNRRGVIFKLNELFEKAKSDKKTFSVILADIDFFKEINDRYGHQAGDDLLVQVTEVIKSTIRKTDYAARWGGEEFLIILPEVNKQVAFKIAEKLRNNVFTHRFTYNSEQLKISMSLGFAESSEAASIDELLILADKRMYEAKARGRNITMPYFLFSELT